MGITLGSANTVRVSLGEIDTDYYVTDTYSKSLGVTAIVQGNADLKVKTTTTTGTVASAYLYVIWL